MSWLGRCGKPKLRPRPDGRRALLVGGCALAGLAGCGGGAWGTGGSEPEVASRGPGFAAWATSVVSPHCREAGFVSALPDEVRESSGVVVAGDPAAPEHGPGSFWTHNDSGWPAEIFRVGTDGALMDRVQVSGAENVDWEDMAAGPCPPEHGSGSRCLYIADTGDNLERRAVLDIYRVPEPGPGATSSEPSHRHRFRLPHGPRDIEAILLLDPETLLLVTKGRNHPVEVYLLEPVGDGPDRWFPETPAEVAAARRVQSLTAGPPGWRGLVTGGSAAPLEDGGWIVALRTYQSLRFFRVNAAAGSAHDGGPHGEGPLVPIPGGAMSLLHLREPQGEGVTLAGGGSVVLTSEGGLAGGPASLRELDCSVGFARWGLAPLAR